MTILTATEARQQFFRLQRNIIQDHDEVRVTSKFGNVVLMNADDYDTLIETINVLQDPVVSHQLKHFDEIPKQRFQTFDEFKETMDA